MEFGRMHCSRRISDCLRSKGLVLALFLLAFSGAWGCANKNTAPEISPVSVKKEVKLRGKVKTIAIMPTYLEIREEGKDGRLIEIGEKQKARLTRQIKQILYSKGFASAEFSSIYFSATRQRGLNTMPAGGIGEVMEDFKAICYVIMANEYDEEYEWDYSYYRDTSIFPEGDYSLSPELREAVRLTEADAVLFTGVWGYIESNKATVIKTIFNTLGAFFGIPIFLLHSNLIQFDAAIVDAESGDVIWFNHGYYGFEPLLSRIPEKREKAKGNETYY